MTVIARCPRCRSESLEIFKTHDYCSQCNFSSDFTEDAIAEREVAEPMIPEWAIAHMELSDADRAEIREINIGKYAPGYELIVDTKRKPRVIKATRERATESPETLPAQEVGAL